MFKFKLRTAPVYDCQNISNNNNSSDNSNKLEFKRPVNLNIWIGPKTKYFFFYICAKNIPTFLKKINAWKGENKCMLPNQFKNTLNTEHFNIYRLVLLLTTALSRDSFRLFQTRSGPNYSSLNYQNFTVDYCTPPFPSLAQLSLWSSSVSSPYFIIQVTSLL